jgi:hypothetical protein
MEKVVISVGGSTARHYIEAADLISEGDVPSEDLDWLGNIRVLI